MHSHHSHSGQFCRHAKDRLEEIVVRAIDLGFTTYGLSEHAPRYRSEDLFPEESDLSPEDLGKIYLDFLKTATDLQRKYRDRIRLLIGLETDFITTIDLDRTKALMDSKAGIQYIVGSVHHVAGVSIDFDRSTYLRSIEHCTENTMGSTMVHTHHTHPTSCSSSSSSSSSSASASRLEMPPPKNPEAIPTDAQLSAYLIQYLDAQLKMIDSLTPEVIGHFDLCLLFNPGYSLKGAGKEAIWKCVERNIKKVINYGGLFEANGAALRKGWETSYPSREVLELIVESGGRVCLSDDSHGIAQVGLNYGRMKDYLVSMGVKEVWHLVGAEEKEQGDEPVGNRGRVLARRVPNWTANTFWADLDRRQA